MTLITGVIDRSSLHHLVAVTAVRIVTGGAADFRISMLVAKQVCRTLVHGFANTCMAAHASLFSIRPGQHPFGRLAVVDTMARDAANLRCVVLTAVPIFM